MNQLKFELNIPHILLKSGRTNSFVGVQAICEKGRIHVFIGTCGCIIPDLKPDAMQNLHSLAYGIAKKKFLQAELSKSFVNPNGELCMN